MKLTAIFTTFVNWLQDHQLPCPVKNYFHIDCPGCGLQRSFIELLNGNLSSSLHYHFATIPLILFFIYSLLHLYFKFNHGVKVIVGGYIFIALIVVSNYIYKILN
ncbi:MAG: DUF2752 domain-containing protein [Bacteroidota bacterium]